MLFNTYDHIAVEVVLSKICTLLGNMGKEAANLVHLVLIWRSWPQKIEKAIKNI